MPRLVVDASTLVSGVASSPSGGTPWLVLAALLDFEAIACTRLIGEFKDALGNRYFQERCSYSPICLPRISFRSAERGTGGHGGSSEGNDSLQMSLFEDGSDDRA